MTKPGRRFVRVAAVHARVVGVRVGLFHRPMCRWTLGWRVTPISSAEASAAGLQPCAFCHPDP